MPESFKLQLFTYEILEREFLIDNLLVRIHFAIVIIWWTGLAPWEVESSFPGSLISTSPEQWYRMRRAVCSAPMAWRWILSFTKHFQGRFAEVNSLTNSSTYPLLLLI